MLDFLGQLLGLNQGDPLIEAADRNRGVIGQYDARGNQIITQGANQAQGYLDQVAGITRPLAGATGMLADANGLNGAGGTMRAQKSFRANPGYQFQRDQGIQALDRTASARGQYQSGGAMADVLGYSQGLADQSYGSWLDRLAGMSNTAIGGQTGALNNLATLATGTANARLGHAGGVASGYMGANNQVASGEQTNSQGLANLGGTLFGMAGNLLGFGGF